MRIKCSPVINGEREFINHSCNKSCEHWEKCWKEECIVGDDGYIKEPRGFIEVLAKKWDIKENNYHYNYKGEKCVWRMGEKTLNKIKI